MLAKSLAARNIPPHDASATTPEAAFTLELMLGPAARNALDTHKLLEAAKGDEAARSRCKVRVQFNMVRQKVPLQKMCCPQAGCVAAML